MAQKIRKKISDPLDTPVMRQFLELKEKVPDAVLFFRMGDFYELFLEDAIEAAPIMDVALTKRQNEIPMAGIPYHSAFIYLSRLLDAGKKIAIAEQKIDPQNPKLMSREIVRVLTPGTLIEEGLLEADDRNYLCAIVPGPHELGVALADISTAEFICFNLDINDQSPAEESDLIFSDDLKQNYSRIERPLNDLVCKYRPQEYLVSSDLKPVFDQGFEENAKITWMEPWKTSAIEGRRKLKSRYERDIRGFGFPESSESILGACSLVLHYMDQVFPDQKTGPGFPRYINHGEGNMELDEHTIRNLDLIVSREENSVSRSLYGVLNHCRTSPGKRLLKAGVLSPMLDEKYILKRQKQIGFFVENSSVCEQIKNHLANVYDIERILVRISANKQSPRDLTAIQLSIKSSNLIDLVLKNHNAESFLENTSVESDLNKLESLLEKSLEDQLPVQLGKGPLIRPGIDAELDLARQARDNGGSLILELEKNERQQHDIGSLKIKYNRLSGYFIEVSKAQSSKVPDHYRPRQALTSVSRFTCDKLDELQTTLLQAQDKITDIESRYFNDFCGMVLNQKDALVVMIGQLANLDLITNLASLAKKKNWVCPKFHKKSGLEIEAGRHPVVEEFLQSGEDFISNDTFLNGADRQFAIITGPNMAGKSTYIRQIAILQLMAQMGSWVPAVGFRTTIVDRIFTRIGAHDNLTRGESTFYVEMLEASRILNQCTDRSLVIMDEVGRGTSTFDGISLASAIVEYLSGQASRPLCFFATHYHELTSLENRQGVFNLTVDVREINGKVLFLHKVREGAADKSYGIHVARLAGMPQWVVNRATEKLKELEMHSELLLDQNSRQNKTQLDKKTGASRPQNSTQQSIGNEIGQPDLFEHFK